MQNGNGIVAAFDQKFNRLRALQCRVKPVEQNRTPARCVWPTLRVKIASLADSPRR